MGCSTILVAAVRGKLWRSKVENSALSPMVVDYLQRWWLWRFPYFATLIFFAWVAHQRVALVTSVMSSLGTRTPALFACGLALSPGGLLSSMAERAQYYVVCESSLGPVFSCTASVTVSKEGVGAGLPTVRSVSTTMTKVARKLLGQLCLAVGAELESKPCLRVAGSLFLW